MEHSSSSQPSSSSNKRKYGDESKGGGSAKKTKQKSSFSKPSTTDEINSFFSDLAQSLSSGHGANTSTEPRSSPTLLDFEPIAPALMVKDAQKVLQFDAGDAIPSETNAASYISYLCESLGIDQDVVLSLVKLGPQDITKFLGFLASLNVQNTGLINKDDVDAYTAVPISEVLEAATGTVAKSLLLPTVGYIDLITSVYPSYVGVDNTEVLFASVSIKPIKDPIRVTTSESLLLATMPEYEFPVLTNDMASSISRVVHMDAQKMKILPEHYRAAKIARFLNVLGRLDGKWSLTPRKLASNCNALGTYAIPIILRGEEAFVKFSTMLHKLNHAHIKSPAMYNRNILFALAYEMSLLVYDGFEDLFKLMDENYSKCIVNARTSWAKVKDDDKFTSFVTVQSTNRAVRAQMHGLPEMDYVYEGISYASRSAREDKIFEHLGIKDNVSRYKGGTVIGDKDALTKVDFFTFMEKDYVYMPALNWRNSALMRIALESAKKGGVSALELIVQPQQHSIWALFRVRREKASLREVMASYTNVFSGIIEASFEAEIRYMGRLSTGRYSRTKGAPISFPAELKPKDIEMLTVEEIDKIESDYLATLNSET